MSDISKPITENALQENLVELSQQNEQTHLQIQTLNEMVGRLRKENAKLRELAKGMYGLLETYDKIMGSHDACETPRPLIFDGCKSFKDVARELGIEVE